MAFLGNDEGGRQFASFELVGRVLHLIKDAVNVQRPT